MKNFVAEHPDTVLIVIDTFQMVRNTGNEISYASDYNEIEVIKKLAEELKITILLVHHLRKQGDSDPFNMLSGTNGLAGGVDTMFVLDKSKRCSTNATLYCSGRDIEDREIELCFDKDSCTWNFISDSSDNPEMLLPVEMQKLIEYYKVVNLPFMLQIENDYARLSPGNRFFLILQDMGMSDEQMTHILGVSDVALRVTRSRLRQKRATTSNTNA